MIITKISLKLARASKILYPNTSISHRIPSEKLKDVVSANTDPLNRYMLNALNT